MTHEEIVAQIAESSRHGEIGNLGEAMMVAAGLKAPCCACTSGCDLCEGD